MSDQEREYMITTPDAETTNSLWDDLIADYPTADTVPNRPVEIANPRDNNPINTSYYLTDAEAEELRKDPRVLDVFPVDLVKPVKFAFQDGNFSKDTTQTGDRQNWGLLRHIKTSNVFGTSTSDPGGTYDYVLDGTGVDVVIVDSGIEANHPEFEDANGVSRVKQIDWYAVSGVSGTMPANFYTDYDGHGTHVAATVAGKTFGWAKNADIYAIKLNDLKGAPDPGNGISVADMMDCILGWHSAKTNGRPTVVNNSWGYLIFWRTADNALSFQPSGGTTYSITGGSYRGTPWSGSTYDTSKGHTGNQFDTGVYAFSYTVTSVDSDISLLINSGIVICNAAGNESLKQDILGGLDYDNYISANTIGNFYYHRGGSPNTRENPGFEVGSLGPSTTIPSGLDVKSSFSNSGPGVDIYAAGSRIMSAMSEINDDDSSISYQLDSLYKQQLLSGTSMAAPQVAGMCALLLQVHPDWTTTQVYNWMVNNSESDLYDSGLDDDYTNAGSILGGGNRLAYFPMNGQKVFEISGS